MRFAKFSRKQEASVVPKNDFNTVWVFEYADPKVRFQYVGKPVRVNIKIKKKAILKTHKKTFEFILYNIKNR